MKNTSTNMSRATRRPPPSNQKLRTEMKRMDEITAVAVAKILKLMRRACRLRNRSWPEVFHGLSLTK